MADTSGGLTAALQQLGSLGSAAGQWGTSTATWPVQTIPVQTFPYPPTLVPTVSLTEEEIMILKNIIKEIQRTPKTMKELDLRKAIERAVEEIKAEV